MSGSTLFRNHAVSKVSDADLRNYCPRCVEAVTWKYYDDIKTCPKCRLRVRVAEPVKPVVQ